MNRRVLVGAMLLSAGCGDSALCGTGTILEGTQCVLVTDAGQPSQCCGTGTELDPALGCVPVESRQCGDCSWPIREGNIIECDDGDGCLPLSCPNPAPGKISLCGRLLDAQTSLPTGDLPGELCDGTGGSSADGACTLGIRFLDAVALEGGSEVVLAPTSLRMVDCGFFAAESLDEPASGAIAIVVDDSAALDPPVDDHVPATRMLPAAAGLRRNDVIVHAVRRSTDALWTSGAGDPFTGQTFSDVGAHLMVFMHGEFPEGVPVAGVAVQGGQAFYFSDTDPWQRASIDTAMTATGPDGAALHVGDTMPTVSGGEPTDCYWPTWAIGNIPGYVRVDLFSAEIGPGNTCP